MSKRQATAWMTGRMPRVKNKALATKLVELGVYPSLEDALVLRSEETEQRIQEHAKWYRKTYRIASHWPHGKPVAIRYFYAKRMGAS
jgi:hypothetical protein